jgi:hypothetical protein
MQQITTKGTSIFWLASDQVNQVALLEVLKMPQRCKSLSSLRQVIWTNYSL